MNVAVPKRTQLERFGLNLFEKRGVKLGPVVCDDEINFLNARERADLRRIQRGAVLRAATAGALSGLASGVAEFFADPLLRGTPDPSFDALAHYWGIVGGVTLVATAFELSFLYWDSLRSVHALTRAAGLELVDSEGKEAPEALALVRAALELPNPSRPVLGVDPHREISRARVLVATLVYKAKISVTNFILKAVIRRFFGRTVVRAWPAFVAMPVVGLWNALVTWRVVREARIRIMGPSAAREYLGLLLDNEAQPSALLRSSLLRAVGGSIVRSRTMHPNHVELLEEMVRRVGSRNDESDLDDWHHLLEDLPRLTPQEQKTVLGVLRVAVVIDGKISGRERKLLIMAHAACDRPLDGQSLRRLFRQFVRGDPVDRALFE